MFDVVTFGSGVVDVFVNTDSAKKKNFICYPVGEKILVHDTKFDIGGGGTNTAVAFSRLGLRTGWIGKVSNDHYGKMILSFMKKERVKFLGRVDSDKISGYSIVLDSIDKRRTILVYKGCNDYIDLTDIKIRKVRTKWIYCSSLMGKSFETQRKVIKILVEKGVKFAFNPSSYMISHKNIKELLKKCEILVLNKEEGENLLKKYDIERKDISKGICKLGPKIAVITNRDKKIECCDNREGKNKKYNLKPSNLKAKERTGAGDAFASGFVAGIIVGKNVSESLKLGLKESEAVIRYFGAKNHLLKMNIK